MATPSPLFQEALIKSRCFDVSTGTYFAVFLSRGAGGVGRETSEAPLAPAGLSEVTDSEVLPGLSSQSWKPTYQRLR